MGAARTAQLLACLAAVPSSNALPPSNLTAFIVDPRERRLFDAARRARRALGASVPIVAFTPRGKNWTTRFDVAALGNVRAVRIAARERIDV